MTIKLDMFNKQADGQRFAAGEQIFRAGDAGEVMYVILEGEVELRIGSGIVEVLGPGEPFGEMALIDHAPRAASAKARTACCLIPLAEKRFLYLVQQHPYFALQLMKVLAERLRKMDSRALA